MAQTTTTSSTNSQDKDKTIRAYYNPEGIEKQMLIRVYQRYLSMKDSPDRKIAEGEWERGRKQWEALREDRASDEWQSNHYVPITTSVVESALSEVIDQSPKPLILPRGAEDNSKSIVMSHVFEYTWEVSDSDLEFEDVVHDAFIEGTGIGQEYYFSDIRKIKTKLVEGKKDDWVEEEKTDFDDCYLESVKNDDFFVDETARGFTGPFAARDCLRRYIMNVDDAKNFFSGPVWDPFGNSKYIQAGGDTNYYEWYKPPQGMDHSKYVECLWYWSVKPDDWLCIVVNDVMVFMGPNPYKHKQLPFARAIDVKRTHRFYGKGEAALLESIQDELNTLRRMTIDRNHLDIDKMFFTSNRLNLSEEDLVARPHGMIPVDDVNGAKAIEYGDVPRSVELSMGHLEDDSTIVTGINPRAQALPTTGTATEAAILKESTLKRIRLKVRRIEREFLTRIARLRVSNILQYYPQPKLEKIIGEEETEEYKKSVEELKSKGLIQEQDGIPYQKKYRQIRLENVDLVPDVNGEVKSKQIQGFSFFDLNPEYFLPNRGGFDIKFAAGSTLPISKPLLQSKTTEMYDRLAQVAIGVPNTYDIKKLGDMLIRVNDMNPSDFTADQPIPTDDAETRVQMAVELANTENSLMIRGKQIPPTAYQPAAHTLIHIQFTKSPTFQALGPDDPIVKNFTDHITGELAALADRENNGLSNPAGGQAGGSIIPSEQPTAQAGGNRVLNDVIPAKIQGGGQVPAAV